MNTPTLSDFTRLASARRSVRAYKPDPVPEDLLRAVLDAAHLAPSACNKQPWRFVVVRDESARRRLSAAYSRDWFWTAPVIVAVCVEPAAGWIRPYDAKSYAWVDGAIAMDHLTLAAAAAGLGTCWIGAFEPEAARAALSLPDGWEIVAMTPLGYPAPDPSPRPRSRKPLSDVISFLP
jgi:nitroreductase